MTLADMKRPEASHIWAREEHEHSHRRAIEIGTAGEHIVCADMILKGHRAFLSAAGLPYDIIADINGTLVRIAVKSTAKPIKRPAREGNRTCYSFAVTRATRLTSGKTDARAYSRTDVDVIAFCALDQRKVAYCHILECATSMHIDPIGSPVREMYPGKIPGRERKTFEYLSITRALGVHTQQILPSRLKGRPL